LKQSTIETNGNGNSRQEFLISPDDNTPWYALRVFNRSLRYAMTVMDSHGMTYFVPMEYRERTGPDKKTRKVLMPVVSNFLFLKKTSSAQEVNIFLSENSIPAELLKKSHNEDVCEISAREMREFIYICDPERVNYRLLAADEAAMIPGSLVEVTHGPLKGCRGRLVRKKHLHYLLNIYGTFAIMAKVTKWCCRPLTE
jgi:hypothetical protein